MAVGHTSPLAGMELPLPCAASRSATLRGFRGVGGVCAGECGAHMNLYVSTFHTTKPTAHTPGLSAPSLLPLMNPCMSFSTSIVSSSCRHISRRCGRRERYARGHPHAYTRARTQAEYEHRLVQEAQGLKRRQQAAWFTLSTSTATADPMFMQTHRALR